MVENSSSEIIKFINLSLKLINTNLHYITNPFNGEDLDDEEEDKQETNIKYKSRSIHKMLNL